MTERPTPTRPNPGRPEEKPAGSNAVVFAWLFMAIAAVILILIPMAIGWGQIISALVRGFH